MRVCGFRDRRAARAGGRADPAPGARAPGFHRRVRGRHAAGRAPRARSEHVPHRARRGAGGDPGHRARRHRAQGTGTGAAQPDDHRRPDEALQPAGLPHAGRAAPEAGGAEEDRRVPAVCRSRRAEDHQRHLRAPRRRPRAGRRGRYPAPQLPQRRYHRAPGRRRVHRVSHRGGARECVDPDRAARRAAAAPQRRQPVARATGLALSVGIARFEPDSSWTIDQLLEHADKALYQQKRQRRRVASAHASGLLPSPTPLTLSGRGRPRQSTMSSDSASAASVRLPTPAPSCRRRHRFVAVVGLVLSLFRDPGLPRTSRTATCAWPAAW